MLYCSIVVSDNSIKDIVNIGYLITCLLLWSTLSFKILVLYGFINADKGGGKGKIAVRLLC